MSVDDAICRPLRQMARNALLANRRLDIACMALGPGEWEAARTSFFPSLKETLNHILTIDWFYVDALEGGTLGPKAWDPEEPFDAIGPLAAAQFAVDQRLLTFCTGLTDAQLAAETRVHRTGRVQVERAAHALFPSNR